VLWLFAPGVKWRLGIIHDARRQLFPDFACRFSCCWEHFNYHFGNRAKFNELASEIMAKQHTLLPFSPAGPRAPTPNLPAFAVRHFGPPTFAELISLHLN